MPKKSKSSKTIDKVISGVKRIQEWQKAPERAEKSFLSGDKETFKDAKVDYNSSLSDAMKRRGSPLSEALDKKKKKKKKGY